MPKKTTEKKTKKENGKLKPHVLPKNVLTKYYNAVGITVARNSNPNGDPDAGGAPRQDGDGYAWISPGAWKRHLRDAEGLLRGTHRILVKSGTVLQDEYAETDAQAKKDGIDQRVVLCDNYFDMRVFGGVVTGGAGVSVRGPVQVEAARSTKPVEAQQYGITRCCSDKLKDDKETGRMGVQYSLDFAVFRHNISVNAVEAKRPGNNEQHSFRGTGMTMQDLEHFCESSLRMWQLTRSASRTNVSTEALIVFEHSSHLGNGNDNDLADRVQVIEKDGKVTVKVNTKSLTQKIKVWDYRLVDGEVKRKQLH